MESSYKKQDNQAVLAADPTSDPNVSVVVNVTATNTTDATLTSIVERIQGTELAEISERVRAAFSTGGKDAANQIKRVLPGALFAGRFRRRASEAMYDAAGQVVGDIDDQKPEQLSDLIPRLSADPSVVLLFTSPTGTGLKVVVRTGVTDCSKESHLRAFRAVQRFLRERYGVELDPSGKDRARLCFLCHDPNVYYNPHAVSLDLEAWAESEARMESHVLLPRSGMQGISAKRKATKGSRAHSSDAGATVEEGGRNGHLASIAGKWRHSGMTADDISAGLREINDTKCKPPLSEEEVERIALSIGGYAPGERVETEIGTGPVLDRRYPSTIAMRFRSDRSTQLVHHRNRWLTYVGTQYQESNETAVKAELWNYLTQCREESHTGHIPLKVNQALVSNVLDALKAQIYETDGDMPRWIGDSPRPDPADVIAFTNGLYNLSDGTLIQHTPCWFSVNVVPYAFDEQAVCPRWEAFINSVSDGDAEWVATLAMWFGYLLTTDTRQQKILTLVGPPRSGKGTALRVLHQLVGTYNVAGTRLASLGGEFGLAPLVGKTVALIPDAHLGRGTDSVLVLEILKSVSGEDPVCVNVKNKNQVTMRLPVRFIMAMNQLVDLPDPSGAIGSRLVILPFLRSFLGREDLGLTDALVNELPGIANWALSGLRSLRRQGNFIQPAVGQNMRDDFARMSAPIIGFIEDHCKVEPGVSVDCRELFDAWKVYALDDNRHPGSPENFGSKLMAAEPGVRRKRIRSAGSIRSYVYEGIRLRPLPVTPSAIDPLCAPPNTRIPVP